MFSPAPERLVGFAASLGAASGGESVAVSAGTGAGVGLWSVGMGNQLSVEGLSGPSKTGWYTGLRPRKREDFCIGDEYRHAPSTLSSTLKLSLLL